MDVVMFRLLHDRIRRLPLRNLSILFCPKGSGPTTKDLYRQAQSEISQVTCEST